MSTDYSPRNLPTSFTAVPVAGSISPTSLAQDYRPSGERRAAFTSELEKLATAEREELLASADVRL